MKNTYIIVGVIVVAALAYWGYTQYMPKAAVETPSDAAGAKLDINAICDGALAYMTFIDGAAAETFVKDCKEGKHPEVVEKYKADNNLGDGAQY